MAPDRTKFEREKHKNWCQSLKPGESNLAIRNGSIVTKTKVTSQQPMESDKVSSQHAMGLVLSCK